MVCVLPLLGAPRTEFEPVLPRRKGRGIVPLMCASFEDSLVSRMGLLR